MRGRPGTNCCYVDQLCRVGKFHLDYLARTSDMVVNTVRLNALNPKPQT